MKTVIFFRGFVASTWGVALVLASFVSTPLDAIAQPQDAGCQIANAVLGSLFKGSKGVPCGPAANGTTPPHASAGNGTYAGGIDTAENERRVKASLESTYRSLDPGSLDQDPSAGLDACMKAMQPFSRFERMMDSRYEELSRRCSAMQGPMQQQLITAAAELRASREQSKATAKLSAEQQETERVAQIVSELKAGTRKPTNCAQYMVTKGHNPEQLTAPVMHAAYIAPSGIGIFVGNVDRVDGGTIYLNGRVPDLMRLSINPPDHMIAIALRDAQVFAGERISAGAMVEGFAVQSGTRTVTLSDRRTATVAVMSVQCMQRK